MEILLPTETDDRALRQGRIAFWLRRAAECVAPQVEPELESLARSSGDDLVSDQVHRLVVGGPGRPVRWERSWRLVNRFGVALRADLVVGEEREMIEARIDGAVVGECGLSDARGWRLLGAALFRELQSMRAYPTAA